MCDFIYLRSYAFDGKLLILPVDDIEREKSIHILDNCNIELKKDIFNNKPIYASYNEDVLCVKTVNIMEDKIIRYILFIKNNEISYLKSDNLSFEKLLEISKESINLITHKLQDLTI